MIEGIHLCSRALTPDFLEQEIAANNLANLSTTGFKRQTVFRKALLHAEVRTVFEQGPLKRTGNPLDLALDGDGFFTVQTPQGTAYTRNGNFTLNSQGVLITSGGYPILGEGGPVQIEMDRVTEVTVGEDGGVYVDGMLVDRLLLADFEKPYQLSRRGESLFVPQKGVGPSLVIDSVKIRQGYLEGSNVRPVEEMIRMITRFRGYQSNLGAIKSQDETLKRAVNDVGRVRG